jgi:hypothetical protein
MAFLKPAEIQALKRFPQNNLLFERVRATSAVRVTVEGRRALADALLEFVERIDFEVERESIARSEKESTLRLAKLFGIFMDEVGRQAALDETDPRRAGYQRLLTFLRECEAHLVLLTPEQVSHYEQHYQVEPPITYGHDSVNLSLNLDSLRRLRASLNAPVEDVGSTRRRTAREWLFVEFGAVFAASSGEIAASFKPTSGRVDSPFIRFMDVIIDACPPPMKRYLKPGLADAARDWLRSLEWSREKASIGARTINEWRLAIEMLVLKQHVVAAEGAWVTTEIGPANPMVFTLPPGTALILGNKDDQETNVYELDHIDDAPDECFELVRRPGFDGVMLIGSAGTVDEDPAKG